MAKHNPILCVAKVDAWKCSDGTVHPTEATAMSHEAGLAEAELRAEICSVLKSEIECSTIDARLDDGDVAIIVQRLMSKYDVSRKEVSP